MTKIKRGKAGEHIFIAHCLINDLSVYAPVSEDGRIDLIVGTKLHRVQVKILTIERKKKVFYTRKIGCNSRTNTKIYHYTEKDVDFFAVVDLDEFAVYLVPIEIIMNYKSAMTLQTLSRIAAKNDLSLLTNWHQPQDSNPHLTVLETVALPLS